MKIETRFDMYERVSIVDMEMFPGTITEIKLCSGNPEEAHYCVEYWWDGAVRTAWLFSWELERAKTRASELKNKT